MIAYFLKRLAVAVPTLLVLIVVSYVLMYVAPGGPFDTERALAPEILANLERKYGLDRPLVVQIWRYLVSIVTEFDFGPSFRYTDRSVNDIIRQGFPVTLTYGAWSFAVAVLVGVSLGGRGRRPPQLRARPSRGRGLDRRSGAAELRPRADPDPRVHPLVGMAPRGRLAGRAVALPGHAGHRALDLLHGLDRPDHPLLHAGGAERGLHPHRPREGSPRASGRLPPRPQARDAPRRLLARPRVRGHDHGLGGHRRLLRDRGHRAVLRQLGPRPRLPGHHGGHHPRRGPDRPRQPGGRPPLRLDRPPDPVLTRRRRCSFRAEAMDSR